MFFVWYLVFYDFVSFSFSFFIFLRNIYIHIFIYILRSDTKPAVAFTNQYFQNLKPILKKKIKSIFMGVLLTLVWLKRMFSHGQVFTFAWTWWFCVGGIWEKYFWFYAYRRHPRLSLRMSSSFTIPFLQILRLKTQASQNPSQNTPVSRNTYFYTQRKSCVHRIQNPKQFFKSTNISYGIKK